MGGVDLRRVQKTVRKPHHPVDRTLTGTRIGCLWFVMSQVVSTEADTVCSRFDVAGVLPLSSNKTMWESRSREEWETEKAFYDLSYPMTTFQDIVEAKKRSDDPLMARRMDAWEAGADKLGVLLNIATAFV